LTNDQGRPEEVTVLDALHWHASVYVQHSS